MMMMMMLMMMMMMMITRAGDWGCAFSLSASRTGQAFLPGYGLRLVARSGLPGSHHDQHHHRHHDDDDDNDADG
eukprot:1965350-Karenia_brevis.AAC.1